MFKIVATPRAWWPVIWSGVAEDGEVIENRIELQFQILKVDDAVGVMREGMEAQDAVREGADKVVASVAYAQAASRVVLNWRGVLAENDEPLPFTLENLALLMNEPGLFDYVMDAYRGLLSAKKAVREGN